jgi:hypothetical protein
MKDSGIKSYYKRKIDELEGRINEKNHNIKRLEA